ncbi:MAG: hypothetical protein Q7T55_18670, partial [Solirubrobacteraceae bacterium]|nr:hypothetical protein [Solirubrobacteraceae bacterium]
IGKATKTSGATAGTSPLGGYDAQQIVDAMDLDAGTWVKDPKVEDGGEIDGVATQKVSGEVDAKSVIADITDGLRKLPAAVPNLPGVKQLEDVSGASDADVKELEDAITKLDLAVWVGKDDKVQRRMTLDIGIDTKEDGEPIKADVLIDVTTTKLNQPQGIAAPKDTQPITDLILKLQSQFGALFGGAGGAMGGGPTAKPATVG